MSRIFAFLLILSGAGILGAQTTPPDCNITISGGGSVSIGAGSYSNAFNVSGTPSGCKWTASSNNSDWLTLSFGTSGTTSGIVGYTAAANNSISARSGSIKVNNATFTVNQAAGTCTYSVSPTSTSASSSGAVGNFAVNTFAGCNWTANTTASWISISSGSGTGPGNVSYSIAPNNDIAARTGTITAGTATFTVNQGGACGVTLSPVSINVPPSGYSGSISIVATSQSCDHNAVSNVSWITITSGASGTGNGNVNFTVQANTTSAQRVGTISIGNQTVTITQDGANCTFTLFPNIISAPVSGASGKISVTTTCSWTASSDSAWLVVTSGSSGTGNGTVTYAVSANTSPQTRFGNITIGAATVGVTQAAAGCTFTIDPASASAPVAGGTGSISVTASTGCSWTAASNATWVTVSSGQSGTGEGTVVWTAAANTSVQSRTATITIAGQPFTLTQAGANCTYVLSPPDANVPTGAGTYSVQITTPCSWTASSSVPWITLPSGSMSGTGSGTVTYSVAANTSGQSRTGAITIGGQTFTVTQSAFSCSFSISPNTATLPGDGASSRFQVTSGNGCTWTPSASDPWITIKSWSNVNGSGTIEFAVVYNNYLDSRTGTISVAGQTFTVTQTGGGPKLAKAGVVNAASYQGGAVAPGEIVTLFGSGLGPVDGVSFSVDQGFVGKVLGGARVLFDGVPAAMIYTSFGQVSAVAPYSLAGKTSTELKLEYLGVPSAGVTLDVAQSAPAIFTMDASGSGAGAILNQDSGVNSASKPAAKNSVVMIFATGDGQTNPDGVDGKVTPNDPNQLPRTRLNVTATIGGITAPVTYAGGAPGLIAGVVQINVRVPSNAPTSNTVPVVVRIGNGQTQANVTMAIR